MPNRINLNKLKRSKAQKATKVKKPKKSIKNFSIKNLKVNFCSVKMWTYVMLIAGLGVLGAGGYVWYQNILTDQDRIFYGMIAKSLETDSVSRTITQSQPNRLEKQNYYLTFTPNPYVNSTSRVEQVDQNRERSVVNTETIGTRDTDFVRYTGIEIAPGSQDKTDYSKVVNTWAKRETSQESGQQAQFLNEAIFTFVLFGNFNQQNRDELVNMIKDKQVYNLSRGKVQFLNGRPVYSMDVNIKPRALIEVLKRYNELTGLGDASLLNPEQYDNSNSFGLQIKIDMLSRHLTELSYPGDSRVEDYQSYGLNRQIEIPENAITVEELQAKLQ